MDVAVLFKRYNIGDNKYFFEPIEVTKGTYYPDKDIFITEYGSLCNSLSNTSVFDDKAFGYPISLNELMKDFDDEDSEVDILSEYYHDISGVFYFGLNTPSGNNFIITVHPVSYSDNAQLVDGANPTDISFLIPDKVDFDVQPTAKKKVDRAASRHFNLAKLRSEVLGKIVAQDDAVKKITTTLGVNFTSKNPKNKSHIMLIGPSGTGKTEMINIIADYLGIPCFKADATAYTEEGYVGKSVYSILTGLLDAADGDLEKAQNGIIIIDEIDKKAGSERNDVSRQSVLYSLLKIMDRTVVEVSNEQIEPFYFDTSNLTIICMGAFTELFKEKSKNSVIGFSEEKSVDRPTTNITKEDLINYGMTSEFMGRIRKIVYTKSFTFEDIVELLYKSKISPIRREREWFKDQGVSVTFERTFIDAIAKKSVSSKSGARGIDEYVNAALSDAHEEVLMNPGKVKSLRFSAKTVDNPKKYGVK